MRNAPEDTVKEEGGLHPPGTPGSDQFRTPVAWLVTGQCDDGHGQECQSHQVLKATPVHDPDTLESEAGLEESDPVLGPPAPQVEMANVLCLAQVGVVLAQPGEEFDGAWVVGLVGRGDEEEPLAAPRQLHEGGAYGAVVVGGPDQLKCQARDTPLRAVGTDEVAAVAQAHDEAASPVEQRVEEGASVEAAVEQENAAVAQEGVKAFEGLEHDVVLAEEAALPRGEQPGQEGPA